MKRIRDGNGGIDKQRDEEFYIEVEKEVKAVNKYATADLCRQFGHGSNFTAGDEVSRKWGVEGRGRLKRNICIS